MLRKIGPGMNGAAVIPHEEIAKPPLMLENELPLLADFIERIEHCGALLGTGKYFNHFKVKFSLWRSLREWGT